MATINDIIARAFQSTGVTRIGQSPSGDESTYALGILNEMLAKWASDSIGHGLVDVTTATVVYDGALISAIRKNLAVELLNGPFEGVASQTLQAEAMDEKLNLMPYDGEVQYSRALSQRVTYNIASDS